MNKNKDSNSSLKVKLKLKYCFAFLILVCSLGRAVASWNDRQVDNEQYETKRPRHQLAGKQAAGPTHIFSSMGSSMMSSMSNRKKKHNNNKMVMTMNMSMMSEWWKNMMNMKKKKKWWKNMMHMKKKKNPPPKTPQLALFFEGLVSTASWRRGEVHLEWLEAVLVDSDGFIVVSSDDKDDSSVDNTKYSYSILVEPAPFDFGCNNDDSNNSRLMKRLLQNAKVIVTGNTTSWTMENLTPGVTYDFLVIASTKMKTTATGDHLTLVSNTCKTSQLQVQTETSTFKDGLDKESDMVVGPLFASPSLSIIYDKSMITMSGNIPNHVHQHEPPLQEGMYISGFDSFGMAFVVRVVRVIQVSSTNVHFVAMAVSSRDVFDTLALNVDAAMVKIVAPPPPPQDDNNSGRRLQEKEIELQLLKIKIEDDQVQSLEDALPPGVRIKDFKTEFLVKVNAKVRKGIGTGLSFDGKLKFTYSVGANLVFGSDLEELKWKIPPGKGSKKLKSYFKVFLIGGWFPLILELNPTAHLVAEFRLSASLSASLELSSGDRGFEVNIKYDADKNPTLEPLSVSTIKPKDGELIKPKFEQAVEVDAKFGGKINFEFLVEKLVGFDIDPTLLVVKLTSRLAISDFLEDPIPKSPRLKSFDVETTIDIPINFKYRRFLSADVEDCLVECKDDNKCMEGDSSAAADEECAKCIELCVGDWEKTEIADIQAFKIKWFALPELAILAGDSSPPNAEQVSCNANSNPLAMTSATAIYTKDPEAIFDNKIQGPYRWTVKWDNAQRQWWKTVDSSTSQGTLELRLPSSQQEKVECVWLRGTLYLEATPSFPPLPYALLTKVSLAKVFQVGELFQPSSPDDDDDNNDDDNNDDPKAGDTCYPEGLLEGTCVKKSDASSCSGPTSFSLDGSCGDGALGLTCCVSNVPCKEGYLGKHGVCRKVSKCPETSSQFTAVNDNCPGGSDIKCCLSDVSCVTFNGYTGNCRPTNFCPQTSVQFTAKNLCPGDTDIRCCLSNIPCEYNGVSGTCQHDSYCSSSEKITAKNLCPGDSSIRCCLSDVSCEIDKNVIEPVQGKCRRSANCPSTATQIPVNVVGDDSICPDDQETNVCCLSDVGCAVGGDEPLIGETGRCSDIAFCPNTDSQFAVADTGCPLGMERPTACCLDSVACKSESHKQEGQCKDVAFCPTEGVQFSVANICPSDASTGVGCCFSNVSCAAIETGTLGGCKALGSCFITTTGENLCEWAVPEQEICPGAPDIRCYIPPESHGFKQGSVLIGDKAGEKFGFSLSLSHDGMVLAVGAPGNRSMTGYVQVFSRQMASWQPLGDAIKGGSLGDKFGHAVALSWSGETIAIGAPSCSGNGLTRNGCAAVYEFNGENWTQKGLTLYGQASDDEFGYSVGMNEHGKVVAIGARFNNVFRGRVYVFSWFANNRWKETLGTAISGDQPYGEMSGSSLSLSGNGQMIAIGSPGFQGEGQATIGRVRVWGSDGFRWRMVGASIVGDQGSSGFGETVSLSGDLLAVGAEKYDSPAVGSEAGRTYLYRFQQDKEASFDVGSWVSIEPKLAEGQQAGAHLGASVAISADGSFAVVGAPHHGLDTGETRVFGWRYGSWRYLSPPIDGVAAGDLSGSGLVLSGNGQVLAIYEKLANSKGQVRVFTQESEKTCSVAGIRGKCIPSNGCDGLAALSWHDCPGDLSCCIPPPLACYAPSGDIGECGASCNRTIEGENLCPDGLSCCLDECNVDDEDIICCSDDDCDGYYYFPDGYVCSGGQCVCGESCCTDSDCGDEDIFECFDKACRERDCDINDENTDCCSKKDCELAKVCSERKCVAVAIG